MFRWINGRDPRQYGMDFGLQDAILVAHYDRGKIWYPARLDRGRRIIARLELTPQKPLQRAYQRDPEADRKVAARTLPKIARQARASGGEVYFWDESGFRADTVHGKTHGAGKVRHR